MPAVARHALAGLSRTLAAGAPDATDAALLGRFTDGRDEVAFAAIVRRHGGLVLDVCRCVLGNDADAEDAFQATFLVLARNAGSVLRAGSLAAWLYGVARRTALKARTAAARRRGHETARPVPTAFDADDVAWRDVRRVVHEELARLPAAYRDALVLCHLRGLTQDAAARELGVSRAAVQKRVERGLAMLRAALSRRGIAPAAVLAVTVPAAAAPPALIDAALAVATQTVAVPANILALTDGGTMFSGKIAALWLVPALVVGAALAGHPASPQGQNPPPKAAPAADDKKPTPAELEMKWLGGEWTVRHAETNGESLLTKEELKDARVVFKDNKAEVKGFEVSYFRDFAFRLDPTKQPKEIDVTFTAGPEKGVTVEGIYIIRKDEMRICLRLMTPELGRPKGYFTGSGTTLYTFILEPVDKKPDPPKHAAPKPDQNVPPPDLKITLPQKTPFDGDPKKQDGYLGGYTAGFIWAQGYRSGNPPEPDKDNLHVIRGWVEGWQAGAKAGGKGELPAKYASHLTWKD